MVGSSFWMNDSKVEAPIRSPAALNTVEGFSARSCLTAPESTAAPASAPLASSRPWKSLIPRIWISEHVGRRAVEADDLGVVVGRRERVAGVEEPGEL